MESVNIGVIGCGYWGVNYVRIFSELRNTQVALICDQRADRLEEIGRRYPEAKLTTDVEDAAQVRGLDAVIIATEATSHYRVAAPFLAAGKHVLIEKPLTTNSRDAEELIALAQSRGVTLMVGHTFVHNDGIRKVKSYVQNGQVGHVYYLYGRRTNLGPIRRDVNALWDLAPHDIAIFNYILDSVPEWVSAVGAKVLRNHREDVGFISLGYPQGIVGHIHVSWAEPNKVREIVVVGSDKRVVFDDLNALERVRVFEKGVAPEVPEAETFGEYQLRMRDGDIVSPKIEINEPLKQQVIHFVESVMRGQPPITGGKDGLEVVRVMEAIDRSVERQGTPITLDWRGEDEN